ncbi:MAG TPA: hypothetical protein VN603_01330 [Candidatus Acidoferrales bacterium]|nr:hypothetical protein [Candidatus Acidoferrales bacterium]
MVVPLLAVVLAAVGFSPPVVAASINVTELGLAVPDLLILDIDGLDTDPLELLRRLRFVLPGCTIAVYSGTVTQAWALACHLAGANCMLSKNSEEAQLILGLREATSTGCFTDPAFAATP